MEVQVGLIALSAQFWALGAHLMQKSTFVINKNAGIIEALGQIYLIQ